MKIKANAKINIALKVVGTRENGYHDLDMIMVPTTFKAILIFAFAFIFMLTAS